MSSIVYYEKFKQQTLHGKYAELISLVEVELPSPPRIHFNEITSDELRNEEVSCFRRKERRVSSQAHFIPTKYNWILQC